MSDLSKCWHCGQVPIFGIEDEHDPDVGGIGHIPDVYITCSCGIKITANKGFLETRKFLVVKSWELMNTR